MKRFMTLIPGLSFCALCAVKLGVHTLNIALLVVLSGFFYAGWWLKSDPNNKRWERLAGLVVVGIVALFPAYRLWFLPSAAASSVTQQSVLPWWGWIGGAAIGLILAVGAICSFFGGLVGFEEAKD